MKTKTTKSSYESPLVRVRALSLERGFAASDGGYGEPGEAGASGSYESENDDF
ncbi:MAG: hypothetical protein SOZ21_02510 [Candidatus Cryptobacteroides sp.]|nr:hypothetical protein [Candidatus Cryptobacteroides sp.]